jgi:hypothetical protein
LSIAAGQQQGGEPFVFIHNIQSTSIALQNQSGQSPQTHRSSSTAVPHHIQKLGQYAELQPVSPLTQPDPTSSQLLFIRGFADSRWIRALGAFYVVDPEYFRRRLDFLKKADDYHDLPSLPSTTDGILRLRVTDIFKRQMSWSDQTVHTMREAETRTVRNYQKQLGQFGRSGESIVRRFSVHDGTTFSTEHYITVTIQGSTSDGKGWTGSWCAFPYRGFFLYKCDCLTIGSLTILKALIWSDIGDPLNKCPEGPWLDRQRFFHHANELQAVSVPTIIYRPYSAFNHENRSDHPAEPERQTENLFQTASLLPGLYGKALDPDATRLDAFYALSELFAFIATSENQFLNFMELRVDNEIYSTKHGTDFSITNLKHSRELLVSHAQSLEETLRFIRNKSSHDWPMIPPNSDKADMISRKHQQVVEDFDHLLSRARSLSVRCLEGVSLITNDVMLQESRKAMVQGQQTRTLTLLAFFYLPITMATGFFGMNFKEFGQGELSIWIGVFVAMLLLLFQSLAYVSRRLLLRKWRAWSDRR